MSVVIITGSTGLVGSESVNFFCKKGFEVIGIDTVAYTHLTLPTNGTV